MLHDVTLDLGGQVRTLRCDLGAWAAVEDHGEKLQTLLGALANGGLSFRQVRILLTAMLWRDGVTPEQVGEWVTGENFQSVMERAGDALRSAFPAESTPDPPPGAPSGTGNASSNSGPTAG